MHNSNELLIDDQKEVPAFNASLQDYPIHFWSADERIYKINECRIFSHASMGNDGSLANLGIAWIAWSIEISEKFMAAYAIYYRGNIVDFTLIEGLYDEVFWAGIQDNLILITSTPQRTKLTLYSTTGNPIGRELNFNSTGHKVRIDPSSGTTIFLYQNGTIPTNVIITGTSLNIVETNATMIDGFLDMALFHVEGQKVLSTREGSYQIPNSFSNESRLGHYLSRAAVFDVVNGKAWIDNTVIDLPDNATNIYPFGLKSSLVMSKDNEIYELGLDTWEKLAQYPPNYEVLDFSIVDVDLFFGVLNNRGINLLPLGGDEDNDFAPDTLESYYGSSPEDYDTDKDTIPDGIEIAFGLDATRDDRLLDYDNDLLSNIDEINMQLDPISDDTDFGGALDGWEIMYRFDPKNDTDDLLDNDNDGVVNSIESAWNSDPYNVDSDGDQIPDYFEITYNLDPTNADDADEDPDNDGRKNLDEFYLGSDPFIPDPRTIFDGLILYFFPVFIAMLVVGNKYIKKHQ